MTRTDFLTVSLLVSLLAATLVVIKALAVARSWPPELPRKAVHIILGLACLSFPWLVSGPAAVWALAAVTSAWLLALRWVPALARGPGRALHGVARQSLGDLLFPVAVAAVFHLSTTANSARLLVYLLPVALLTLADPAGALVGRRPGNHRFHAGSGRKSIEGSTAVFALSFVLATPALLLATELPWPLALAAAGLLAALTTAAEAACDRGADNLVIPLGAWFVLDRLLVLPPELLPSRLILLAVILLTLFGLRRSTSLDPGALLAAALLAYAIAALGSLPLLLPPLVLLGWHFLSHQIRQRCGITPPRHTTDTVLAHAFGLAPLLALPALGWAHSVALPWLFALSSAFMLNLLRLGTRCWDGHPPRALTVLVTPLPPLLLTLAAAVLSAACRQQPLLPDFALGLLWAWPAQLLLSVIFLGLRGSAPAPLRDPWLLHGLLALSALPIWIGITQA